MIDFLDFIIEMMGWTVWVLIGVVTVLLAIVMLPLWKIPYIIYKLKRGNKS